MSCTVYLPNPVPIPPLTLVFLTVLLDMEAVLHFVALRIYVRMLRFEEPHFNEISRFGEKDFSFGEMLSNIFLRIV